MKRIKRFFKNFLVVMGVNVENSYSKCKSTLEKHFQGLSDEEYFMMMAMLDSGINCEMIFGAICVSRRKRSFLRALKELGVGLTSREQLLEKYIEELRGSKDVIDLVDSAYSEHSAAMAKKKALGNNI